MEEAQLKRQKCAQHALLITLDPRWHSYLMAITFVMPVKFSPQIEVFYFITLLEGKYPLPFNE